MLSLQFIRREVYNGSLWDTVAGGTYWKSLIVGQTHVRNLTLNLTDNQSNAANNAFVDFMWQKYQTE